MWVFLSFVSHTTSPFTSTPHFTLHLTLSLHLILSLHLTHTPHFTLALHHFTSSSHFISTPHFTSPSPLTSPSPSHLTITPHLSPHPHPSPLTLTSPLPLTSSSKPPDDPPGEVVDVSVGCPVVVVGGVVQGLRQQERHASRAVGVDQGLAEVVLESVGKARGLCYGHLDDTCIYIDMYTCV